MHASKLKDVVDQYIEGNKRIVRLCKQISDTLILRIDTKRTRTASDFEAAQEAHRAEAERLVVDLYHEIIKALKKIYEVFRTDGPDVQQQWRKYAISVDKQVEDALRINIKKSLQVNYAITLG
jgi:dynein heavy chain